ncbi:MAG: phosphorylase [Bacteroidetes bacterium RIFCSPLOWO2_02_FULL_36_8]|nr:MAG: phosphorylase [Bacteroidetes bacterium RIFCSPLOWO2_02_FULL_36_8]OFY70669.1 MAG: phosphorylase [Bacteroidetes bacterium RIFCSPLOWO2_12_FULL_37_12]
MPRPFPESDLILNSRGSIYHLDLRPEEIADIILVGGDPGRIKKISRFFDRIEFKNQKREFVTHTGYYKGKRITALSTGIGPDNIDIVFNELDALANIDLQKRIPKPNHKTLKIIRIGTSGSLQENIPPDSFVFSTHGIGQDGLLNFYKIKYNGNEKSLCNAFIKQFPTKGIFARPYAVEATLDGTSFLSNGFIPGITVTCGGFYGPQGRILRYQLTLVDFIKKMNGFNWRDHKITNFEMETSAMYGLGKILGHKTCTVTAIVANRISGEVTKNGSKAMDELIYRVLENVKDLS